jgi:single-stranded DNA-binding protein
MGLFALAYGIVVKPASNGTSAKGTDYARLMIRSGDGDGAVFINVTIFDESSIEAVQPLQKGDAVAVSGAFQLAPYLKDGIERMGYTLFNAKTLTAAKPKPRPRPRNPKPVGTFDAEAWFGKEAGEL